MSVSVIASAPFLRLNDLSYTVRQSGVVRHIIHDLNLAIGQHERIALVGESGSGKSTLLKLILGLALPQSGDVRCESESLRHRSWKAMKAYRRLVQYIPQDPHTSLPPQQSVARLLAEPVKRLGLGNADQAMLEQAVRQVELPPEILQRKAAELSGGQAQRIALARALIVKPKFLLADEPTSGLDLPLREQMKALLRSVCQQNGMGLLVVTHDISMASGLCDRMLVMHQGHIVEDRMTEDLLASPVTQHTQRLLDAVPQINLSHLASQAHAL